MSGWLADVDFKKEDEELEGKPWVVENRNEIVEGKGRRGSRVGAVFEWVADIDFKREDEELV